MGLATGCVHGGREHLEARGGSGRGRLRLGREEVRGKLMMTGITVAAAVRILVARLIVKEVVPGPIAVFQKATTDAVTKNGVRIVTVVVPWTVRVVFVSVKERWWPSAASRADSRPRSG